MVIIELRGDYFEKAFCTNDNLLDVCIKFILYDDVTNTIDVIKSLDGILSRPNLKKCL